MLKKVSSFGAFLVAIIFYTSLVSLKYYFIHITSGHGSTKRYTSRPLDYHDDLNFTKEEGQQKIKHNEDKDVEGEKLNLVAKQVITHELNS